ncbi:speriolin-like, partial [Emydura macquarii macquarii]|uniref:speriolin-like n=1 Tax=Emydura macquarii macquarii TaxID=1129001 RepID=UPI00352BA9C9
MASLTGRDSPLLDGQPVFACYDMLKREIQALIAENEELRKLVDLMKENQQLRTVIRGQAVGGEMQPPIATSSRTSERGHSNVLSAGPTAESQAFHPSSSPVWTDTIEEGTLSMAPLPLASSGSRTSVSQSASLSEGQISEARARTPASSNRDSADTSKRYRYIRLPSTFNFRAAADNVSHASSPWDSTGSEDVFSNDLTVLPQRISSPTTRTSPINYRMSSSTPETQPPPDV